MKLTAELLLDAHAIVGEGPIWDDEQQLLYWVDIMANTLFTYTPTTGESRAFDVGQHVGTVVPRTSGGVMLAVYDGFAAFDLATQQLSLINNPESHLPNNRFNDGKCDPAGRFWAGTMAYEDQTTQGSLYRLDPDLTVHKMLDNLAISNGIVWSLDQRTMYFVDSFAYDVKAFDYDLATGDITNGRPVIHIPREMGIADGMTIDTEGMLWVAHFGGSRVCRWHPGTGEILQTIHLPVSQVTACAFGGPELDTLYITSAAIGLSDEALQQEPHAGGLFVAKPGQRGLPAFRFTG